MMLVNAVAIAPIVVLGIGATLLMLQIALKRSEVLARRTTLIILLAGFASCFLADPGSITFVTPLLQSDALALVFSCLFCVSAAACVYLSRDYLPGLSDQGDEYYLLMLLATLGAVVLVYAAHVASLLLGLELLSVSLYALIAYPSREPASAEAASKYLVLSGAASATMLFGFALLYALSGSLEFATLAQNIDGTYTDPLLPAFAAVLIVAGIGFKLSAAPFHLWTPDVYEGSPAPVTAFLASVGKAAPFIALLRLAFASGFLAFAGLVEVLAALAIASMLVGNLLALLQSNLKRKLAYSSIAHIGYALVIFCVAVDPANASLAGEAGAFYMIAYVPTSIAAFALISLINPGGSGADSADQDQLTGLFWRDPLLGFLMLVALLSLAGIPLTAGFIAKFYVVAAAVAGAHWVLLGALLLGSAIAIYYYLRVVFRMSQRPAIEEAGLALGRGDRSVLVLLALVILGLGIFPQTLMEYLKAIF